MDERSCRGMGLYASVALIVASGVGNGGCAASPPRTEQPETTAQPVPVAPTADPAAHMKRYDREGWTDARCDEVAAEWRALAAFAAAGHKPSWPALYNAGLGQERCRHDDAARRAFEEALTLAPSFHRARVKVALYHFASAGDAALDDAIREIERAVRDADFKDPDALVSLAILERRRHNSVADDDGENDFERARKNLERALAVDDGYMPAYNQLALYHLERASGSAGQGRAGAQELDLGALVVAQALRRDARYAPVHNTRGLIARAASDLAGASAAFARARELDPHLFEADMNYASVNLEFRAFKEAETGYRAALVLRPRDYEAHLGLALALRGRLADPSVNYPEVYAEVVRELEAAKRIAPARPEAYYNQAVLTEEFEARTAGQDNTPALGRAKALFAEFAAKAGDAAEYADAAKRARDRMADIDEMVRFAGQKPGQ